MTITRASIVGSGFAITRAEHATGGAPRRSATIGVSFTPQLARNPDHCPYRYDQNQIWKKQRQPARPRGSSRHRLNPPSRRDIHHFRIGRWDHEPANSCGFTSCPGVGQGKDWHQPDSVGDAGQLGALRLPVASEWSGLTFPMALSPGQRKTFLGHVHATIGGEHSGKCCGYQRCAEPGRQRSRNRGGGWPGHVDISLESVQHQFWKRAGGPSAKCVSDHCQHGHRECDAIEASVSGAGSR